ncbi:MAG: response regulator transcription factor [gamma proteobacterium symbiont of Taylorina sp.]|nr:response regulator transcription factor [gamma proteobacterium symbiont of Taylorina sp.]
MKILLIEDDKSVAEFIIKGLIEKSHVVDHRLDGKEGLFMATTESYDVMIIDRMLPGIDGLTIIRTLRASKITASILILSAMADVEQRVEGLQSGADDYLVKPFSFSELHARVEILGRRNSSNDSQVTELIVADLKVDLISHKVTRSSQNIELLATEYRLLEYLMRHAGQVVSRTMLLEHVWDYHFDPQTNVIDVHMSRLRKKIDKQFNIPLIQTIRGSGYVLKVPEPSAQ